MSSALLSALLPKRGDRSLLVDALLSKRSRDTGKFAGEVYSTQGDALSEKYCTDFLQLSLA
jgi:hypothetical protein